MADEIQAQEFEFDGNQNVLLDDLARKMNIVGMFESLPIL